MFRRAVLAALALGAAPASFVHFPALAQGQAAAGATASALPRVRGPIELGKDAFAIFNACRAQGWQFFPREGEEVKSRRGVRYVLTAANVLPPTSDSASRYRLTFLDGRLIGLRTEYRKAEPARIAAARAAHGAPAWEAAASAEWVSPDRSAAFAVWRDGTRDELVDLGLAKDRGFYTEGEITQELRRRKQSASSSPPAAPSPLPAPSPAPAK